MNYRSRVVAGYVIPIAWILALLALSGHLSPVERFAGATVGLLFAIKLGAWVLVRARRPDTSLTAAETLLFLTIWPGVRPDRLVTDEVPEPDPREFVVGYALVGFGVVLGIATVLAAPILGTTLASWLLIASVLFCVHFGVSRLLPFSLRWMGVSVPDLFDRPLGSRSIADFWSTRWNKPFVDMNRLFVTRPLTPRFGFGAAAFTAFAVSAVLHELAISYPAGGGWGLPSIYFLLQAALYAAERRFFPDDERTWPIRRRAWTWAGVLLPLPLLFHAPFRAAFVVPVVEFGHDVLLSQPVTAYLAVGLWIGAAAHFLVLAASFQVPRELEWREELAPLKPLNRKLMWTYGGYVVLCIVTFGAFTAVFHGEFVDGNPVALGVSAFVAIFWGLRILIDFLYFSHDDWPDGVEYVVGHALLTSLFTLLVAIYGGTVLYHLV